MIEKILGLLCLGAVLAAPLAAAPAPWVQGDLSARLLDAGYAQDKKTGAWEAELVLRFRNLSTSRRYGGSVEVQFLDANDKKLSTWKTFLSLPAGQAQHRRVRAPDRLGCQGNLERCNGLKVRLALKKPLAVALPIPANVLPQADLPPEGVALYVARVYDGDTLQLMDGQKVRLLGIDAPERGGSGSSKRQTQPFAKEATEYLAGRVMDTPVILAYEGDRHDVYGRVLALVKAEDGGSINLELVRRGLAKVYERSEFEDKALYREAELRARKDKQGLWSEP